MRNHYNMNSSVVINRKQLINIYKSANGKIENDLTKIDIRKIKKLQ